LTTAYPPSAGNQFVLSSAPASAPGRSDVSLDQPQGRALVAGAGNATIVVDLHQSVLAIDLRSSYPLALVLRIVPSF
jgi:hypothetical protein